MHHSDGQDGRGTVSDRPIVSCCRQDDDSAGRSMTALKKSTEKLLSARIFHFSESGGDLNAQRGSSLGSFSCLTWPVSLAAGLWPKRSEEHQTAQSAFPCHPSPPRLNLLSNPPVPASVTLRYGSRG